MYFQYYRLPFFPSLLTFYCSLFAPSAYRLLGSSEREIDFARIEVDSHEPHAQAIAEPKAAPRALSGQLMPCGIEVKVIAAELGHQALHARLLGFVHPSTGKRVRWESPLPEDVERAIARLREHAATRSST